MGLLLGIFSPKIFQKIKNEIEILSDKSYYKFWHLLKYHKWDLQNIEDELEIKIVLNNILFQSYLLVLGGNIEKSIWLAFNKLNIKVYLKENGKIDFVSVPQKIYDFIEKHYPKWFEDKSQKSLYFQKHFQYQLKKHFWSDEWGIYSEEYVKKLSLDEQPEAAIKSLNS